MTERAVAQRVTLKSGLTLAGEVTTEGEELTVRIDESTLRFPLTEVASIVPRGSSANDLPERFLLMTLEAQALGRDASSVSGLIAEAWRLRPEDARIAFWYAHSLEAVGSGSAAQAVVEPRRAAFLAAYPGSAERLFERIDRRMRLERLPAELREKVDQLNRLVASSRDVITSDRVAKYAVFRVVDSEDQPLGQDAFRVNCSGSNHSLETYPDGYFLATYQLNRSYRNAKCELIIQGDGLRATTFDISGSSLRVRDYGDLVVTKLVPQDRRERSFAVVDSRGAPLTGALVRVTRQGARQPEPRRLRTADDGRCSVSLYPGRYHVNVSHDGYLMMNRSIRVGSRDNAAAEATRFRLEKAIQTRATLVWCRKERGASGYTKPRTEKHGAGTANLRRLGPNEPRWLTLGQGDGKPQIEIADWLQRYGRPMRGMEPWLKRVTGETAGRFDEIDLTDLDALKDQLAEPTWTADPRNSHNGSFKFSVSEGDVYVGTILVPDQSQGTLQEIVFKLAIESVSGGEATDREGASSSKLGPPS